MINNLILFLIKRDLVIVTIVVNIDEDDALVTAKNDEDLLTYSSDNNNEDDVLLYTSDAYNDKDGGSVTYENDDDVLI